MMCVGDLIMVMYIPDDPNYGPGWNSPWMDELVGLPLRIKSIEMYGGKNVYTVRDAENTEWWLSSNWFVRLCE